MTQREKIEIVERIRGNQDGFVIQLKRLKDTIYFETAYDCVVESTLADLEKKKIETENYINVLEMLMAEEKNQEVLIRLKNA